MITSKMNLIMTVIGFALSIMFIIFVFTRLLWVRLNSRSFVQGNFHREFGTLERGINGMERVVVETFPTIKYSNWHFHSREDATCTICLSEYKDKDILRMLPICQHVFHITCIDLWLRQNSTCPVCRVSLRNLDEKNFTELNIQMQSSNFTESDVDNAIDHRNVMLDTGREVRLSDRVEFDGERSETENKISTTEPPFCQDHINISGGSSSHSFQVNEMDSRSVPLASWQPVERMADGSCRRNCSLQNSDMDYNLRKQSSGSQNGQRPFSFEIGGKKSGGARIDFQHHLGINHGDAVHNFEMTYTPQPGNELLQDINKKLLPLPLHGSCVTSNTETHDKNPLRAAPEISAPVTNDKRVCPSEHKQDNEDDIPMGFGTHGECTLAECKDKFSNRKKTKHEMCSNLINQNDPVINQCVDGDET